MIFDNNLKEEANPEKISINTLANRDNMTDTYNPNHTDKINQMLFSQVNTPTKAINPGYNYTNRNELNYLHSNSANQIKNMNSEENFNFEFNAGDSKSKLKDRENDYTENAEFQAFEEPTAEANVDYLKLNLVANSRKNSQNLNQNKEDLNQNNYNNNNNFNNNNNYNYSKYNETPNTKIFTPIKKTKTISLISNSYRSNLSINFGLNTLSLNLVHRGLIIYHNNKKTHFRSRVLKGPPVCLRWVSWLVLNNIPVKRSENIIEFFLSKNIDKSLDKLIIKDIDRTFSSLNSNYFNEFLLKNSLYRILKAYAAVDPEIGYCQGINLITAFLLIVCNYNEKDVFYILISLLSNTYGNNFLVRGFFNDEFPLLKLFVFFFEELFEKYNKKLKEHFDKLELPLDTWAGRWFQTLFTICLPVEMCQRVWDCLFAYGPYFIVSFTLALLKELEPKLICKEENIEILDFFNNLQVSLASENANLKSNNERISNLNVRESNNRVSTATANSNASFNKSHFSIENVIKQALKIKFPDKLFQKLKKKYFITNNIEKDFTEEKVVLKINNEDVDNFTKEFGVDFKNNIMKTMSSNIKKAENPTNNNTPFANENANRIREFNSNKFNVIEIHNNNNEKAAQENNNFIIKQNDENNLKERNDKKINFAYDEFEREEENENDKNRVNLGDAIRSLSKNNLDSLNHSEKNILNKEKKNSIMKNKNRNANLNKNYKLNVNNNINNNDLVISVDNLKYSPRFKTTTASSKKIVKVDSPFDWTNNNKKSFYENAIINTDINIELDSSSNPKPEDENLDISNFRINKNSNKNQFNAIDLKSNKFSEIKNFDIADFETNINCESHTVNSKSNLNSEIFFSIKSPISGNVEFNKHFNDKLKFFTNDQNEFSKKNRTEDANNFVNRNILIDNKHNKISLKTENNLSSGISNGNLNPENLRLNTISDIRNSKDLFSNLNEKSENKFNENPQNPFGFDHKIQITHEDINKSLLNNLNSNSNNNQKNICKHLTFNDYNRDNKIYSRLPNKSNLFNYCHTTNNNNNDASKIFDAENLNSSYALNTNCNLKNIFNDDKNESNHNVNKRPSRNLNFLFTENNQTENFENATKSSKNLFTYDFFYENNQFTKKNLNSSDNINLILNSNSNLAADKISNNVDKIIFNEKSNLLKSNTNNSLLAENLVNNNFNKIKSVINSNANSNKKPKNDNCLINTLNISSNSKIIFRVDSNTKKTQNDLIPANKNKFSHLKYDRSNDQNQFYYNNKDLNALEDKDDNFLRPVDEFSNSETNNIMNRVKNHAFENFRSKNAFDNYTGSKHEKNEIKDAIFKRSKNNPVYVWKKN